MPTTGDPSRDLLFGLLALQNGLIDQGQLVSAFQAWTREKARPMADHLVSRRPGQRGSSGRRGAGGATPQEARWRPGSEPGCLEHRPIDPSASGGNRRPGHRRHRDRSALVPALPSLMEISS